MTEILPTRDQVWELLCTYTKNDRAFRHALAVEAAMRHFAEKQGEDAHSWAMVGLLHDLDYEQYPEDHPKKALEILKEKQWPESWIRAVASHAFDTRTDVKPETLMERTLYAVDELTGLIAATALVRPSKSILDVKVKSVRKKWKENQFAAGVDRGAIEQGAAWLGIELSDLIAETLEAMQGQAEVLGLAGKV